MTRRSSSCCLVLSFRALREKKEGRSGLRLTCAGEDGGGAPMVEGEECGVWI